MESLNRIEIRGRIGNIRTETVAGRQMIHFSMATHYTYKNRDGLPVIETTWHNVVFWPDKAHPGLEQLCNGSGVSVTGRLRARHFADAGGMERIVYEVIAQKVLLDDAGMP